MILIEGELLMGYELRRYSFGETIGKGFNLYFNHFGALVLVSLLCRVPEFIVDQLTGFSAPSSVPFMDLNATLRFLSSLGINLLMTAITGAISGGFVIYIVARKMMDGESVMMGNQSGFKTRIIPLIMLSLLVTLRVVLWFGLLVIPGIVALMRYCLSDIVLLLENKSVGESIKRSKSLTEKNKWRIFGWALVAGTIINCIERSVLWLVKSVIHDPTLISAGTYAFWGLTAPIFTCILIVIYFNLRIEKEGYHIEHLARQFAFAEERKESTM